MDLWHERFPDQCREKARYATGHDQGGPILPPNIWWGTSIENRASAKWALDHLMRVPAPGRLWTSFEPMLEYVDLTPWMMPQVHHHPANKVEAYPAIHAVARAAAEKLGGRYLSWVVLGGPSKQGKAEAPPFRLPDAYRVINDCAAAGVPVFLKQLGANPVEPDAQLNMKPYRCAEHDNHNADPQHWPSQLRRQQFPVAA
jgi:protein gp37